MKSIQKGFTLIELMIVVAIIGILAAIAIPAYQDYTIRSQVSEGLSLAGGVETSMAEYFANHGSWPTNLLGGSAAGDLGFASAPSGKYVSSVVLDTTGGGILITFGNQINSTVSGSTLGINAALSANNDVIWVCGLATQPGTGGSTVGQASTTLPSKYLPSACKP